MTLVPVILSFAVWLALTIGLAPRGGDPNYQISHALGWQFVLGCLLSFAAHFLLTRSDRGLGRPMDGSLWLMMLPLTICAVFFAVAAQAGWPAAPVMGLILVNAVLIATSEEVMFRGVILGALQTRMTLRTAAIGSSILFGLSHVANSLLTGDIRSALIQAVSAMMLGEFAAVLRIRTGSLWPGIVFHTLWNMGLVLMAQAGGPLPIWSFVLPVMGVVVLAIYAMMIWGKGDHVRP